MNRRSKYKKIDVKFAYAVASTALYATSLMRASQIDYFQLIHVSSSVLEDDDRHYRHTCLHILVHNLMRS